MIKPVDRRGRVNGDTITLRAESTTATNRIGRRGPLIGRVKERMRVRRYAWCIHRRLKVVGFSEANDGGHDGFRDHGDHTGFRAVESVNIPKHSRPLVERRTRGVRSEVVVASGSGGTRIRRGGSGNVNTCSGKVNIIGRGRGMVNVIAEDVDVRENGGLIGIQRTGATEFMTVAIVGAARVFGCRLTKGGTTGIRSLHRWGHGGWSTEVTCAPCTGT